MSQNRRTASRTSTRARLVPLWIGCSLLCLAALSSDGSAQTLDDGDDSIFLSYPDSKENHGEVGTDSGSMTYPDLYKDFFSGGAGTWQSLPLVNESTYLPAPAHIEVKSSGTGHASVSSLDGSTEHCFDFNWEKGLFWTDNTWSTYVIARPVDGQWATQQNPQSPSVRNTLFIATRGTGGGIHAEAVPPHFEDTGKQCSDGTPLSGPGLIAGPALHAVRKGHALAYNAGGGASHVWWHHLQRNLELRYYALERLEPVLEGLQEPIVSEVYAMGFSYGAIISEYMVQLFPAQFDGALCFANTLRGVQATLGIHRANSAGAMAGATRFIRSPSFFWLAVDHFLIAEIERIFQSGLLPAQKGTSTSADASNLDILDRMKHLLASGAIPIMRPVLCLTGDEDHTIFYGYFRPELEALLGGTNTFPGTSIPLSKYVKPITLPFDEHGGFQEAPLFFDHAKYEASSHPGGLPYSGDPIDNILEMRRQMALETPFAGWFLRDNPPNEWDYTISNPAIDVGTPGPVGATDYTFDEVYANPTFRDSGSGPLNLVEAWGGNGERAYLGMGIDLGFQDSLVVANVDGDTDPDIFFGDGSGYIQWWEWDETAGALVWRWRSVDLGAGISALVRGEIGGEDVLLGTTASGLLFSIHTFTSSPHTAIAERLVGNASPPNNDPLFTFGGGRERPTLTIGAADQGTTAVYLSGSYIDFQQSIDYKQCLLQLNFTSKNSFSHPSVPEERKQLETLTRIVPFGAAKTNFLGLSWRGYAYHLMVDPAGGLTFDTNVMNSGVGEYLRMAPLDAERVSTGVGAFNLIVGSGSPPNNAVGPAKPLRNFVITDSNGDVQGEHHLGGVNSALCIKVLTVSGDEVLFAVGFSGGKVGFYTIDTQTLDLSLIEDRTVGPPVPVGMEEGIGTFGVTSLQNFTVLAGGPLGGFGPSGGSVESHLVGVTKLGVLFVLEYTIETSPDLGITLDQKQLEEALYGAVGTGLYPNLDHTGNPVCPGGEDEMLVVMPRFTHVKDRDGADPTVYGPAVFAIETTTGDICRKRQKSIQGLANAQALNPQYNPFEVDPGLPLEQTIHVGYESITPVDFGDSDPGIDTIQTSKQGGTWFIRSGTTTLRGFPIEDPQAQPTDPLFEMFFSNRVHGAKDNIGNGIRAGDLVEETGGATHKDEIVLSTAGGRIVVLQWDVPADKPQVLWKSWRDGTGGSDLFTFGGDYGSDYAGLALYDTHQHGSQAPDADGQVEVFTAGYSYQDPSNITQTLPNGEADRNSRILLFDWDTSASALSLKSSFDLGEPGALGLWVGANLGAPDASYPIDVIVGLSQTFRVYGFDPDTLAYTLRWESEWLGSNIGAFNSIQVLRAQPEGEGVVDYVFLGSDGYVYAYKTPVYPTP